MEYVSLVSELNYMTQVVIMLYEDPTKDISSDERFHVELHFSPGVNCCVQKELPPGPGFRPHSRSHCEGSEHCPEILPHQKEFEPSPQGTGLLQEHISCYPLFIKLLFDQINFRPNYFLIEQHEFEESILMEESSEPQCVSYEESGSRKVFIWPKMNRNIHHVSTACFSYVFLKLYIIMLGQAYIRFYSYI